MKLKEKQNYLEVIAVFSSECLDEIFWFSNNQFNSKSNYDEIIHNNIKEDFYNNRILFSKMKVNYFLFFYLFI